MKQITLNIPDNIRIGQYIFNLLERIQRDRKGDNSQMVRCADTFHISDEEMKKYLTKN